MRKGPLLKSIVIMWPVLHVILRGLWAIAILLLLLQCAGAWFFAGSNGDQGQLNIYMLFIAGSAAILYLLKCVFASMDLWVRQQSVGAFDA